MPEGGLCSVNQARMAEMNSIDIPKKNYPHQLPIQRPYLLQIPRNTSIEKISLAMNS